MRCHYGNVFTCLYSLDYRHKRVHPCVRKGKVMPTITVYMHPQILTAIIAVVIFMAVRAALDLLP